MPRASGLRARKSLGQNWLVDPDLRDRVVAAARIDPQDEVLEIGAGPGALTGRLVQLARRTPGFCPGSGRRPQARRS